MVSQVTLGNFFTTSSGKNVLGGIGGSGLDTQTLVKTLTDAKKIGATQDQDQIKVNDGQASALTTFQNLLSTFRSAADALRNPPGVGNDGNNAFKYTTGQVTSNTSVAGSNYISVSSSPGASLQSYSISDITSLATASHQTSGIFSIASADTAIVSASTIGGTSNQFAPGTIVISGQSITLNEGDTLNNVAAKFNAVAANTGIAASVVQVSSGHYQLSLVSNVTGAAASFDLSNINHATVTSGSSALAGAGFSSAGVSTAVDGTDAAFKLNGIGITRSTNTISDVVSGVTFNLLQQTPDSGTKLSVSVKPDTQTVQNSIVGFVNAYNAIKTFAAQQTQLNSDGTYADTAVLANNQTFRTIMSDLTQQVTNEVSGLSGTNSLAALGITFTTQPATSTVPQVDNILNVNDGQLATALQSNFSGVNALFGFTLTSDNPNIKLYSQNNRYNLTGFTLNIDPSTQTYQATYSTGGGTATVNLTATPIGTLGYSLTGPAGTPFEGLQLIYAGTAASTAHITTTKGVADKMYNTSDAAIQTGTGSIAVALQTLKDNTTKLNADIAQINLQADQYQQRLLAQFAALERTISQVNNLLNSLSANDSARIAASGH